ncbi:SDR family NAD(P)-dependent oxidoreductase [Haliangium ochraceum]|uniref:Short-chain dehydrogenase/reductase SDR n=1 Tax=Haliangium ochraceum (strain DSM 14365 / JCM 11303 / SMP-2) TaxID=502025 RepID=D0LVF7_HALO1|nr:glucose 1-dehydrogenase [Haliangium ochraceum]ACY17518.1 short-chain dehydrogenase/reductase SDR [Haliangium ochraceum DSM 14365]
MLRNRIALVTGASRGIGAATARLFAAHGAAVAVNYHRNQAAAEAVVEDIEAAGGRALAVGADVTDEAQVEAMVERVRDQLGAVDLLVLNAGVPPHTAPLVSDRWRDFERKLTLELKAAFLTTQAVLPDMLEAERGCIVAVSSTVARHATPALGAHAASKAALESYARTLAVELGPRGVRVNVVAPGVIRTDATKHIPESHQRAIAKMTPLRRSGTPEDVAGAILMLAADHTGFVTGAYVQVDGGLQQR